MSYWGKMYLGTHQQEMNFIFDTGSSITWVASEAVKCDKSCALMTKYDQEQSDAFIQDTDLLGEHIEYGTGSITGAYVQD